MHTRDSIPGWGIHFLFMPTSRPPPSPGPPSLLALRPNREPDQSSGRNGRSVLLPRTYTLMTRGLGTWTIKNGIYLDVTLRSLVKTYLIFWATRRFHLQNILLSCTLNIRGASSETSVIFYKTARRHISEDKYLHIRENLKLCIWTNQPGTHFFSWYGKTPDCF
jgi:hypothetical protein